MLPTGGDGAQRELPSPMMNAELAGGRSSNGDCEQTPPSRRRKQLIPHDTSGVSGGRCAMHPSTQPGRLANEQKAATPPSRQRLT